MNFWLHKNQTLTGNSIFTETFLKANTSWCLCIVLYKTLKSNVTPCKTNLSDWTSSVDHETYCMIADVPLTIGIHGSSLTTVIAPASHLLSCLYVYA